MLARRLYLDGSEKGFEHERPQRAWTPSQSAPKKRLAETISDLLLCCGANAVGGTDPPDGVKQSIPVAFPAVQHKT